MPQSEPCAVGRPASHVPGVPGRLVVLRSLAHPAPDLLTVLPLPRTPVRLAQLPLILTMKPGFSCVSSTSPAGQGLPLFLTVVLVGPTVVLSLIGLSAPQAGS